MKTAPETTPEIEPKISIQSLTLDHEDSQGAVHRAVERLDLDVRKGEFLCVVGPSGCGKSTLISAVA